MYEKPLILQYFFETIRNTTGFITFFDHLISENNDFPNHENWKDKDSFMK